MDEQQCYSTAPTIGFSRTPRNDNQTRAIPSTNQHGPSAINYLSRQLREFDQCVRSTRAQRFTLQTAVNELPT